MAKFQFTYEGATYTFSGTPLEVANKRRTVEAAQEVTATPTPLDRAAGVGWYEVIHPTDATTLIAYVHEDGSVYFPETRDGRAEFAFAAARGNVHRLIRADSLTPTRPTGDQSGSHAPVQGLDAACAWADYRKDYGASANPDVLRREHKAFLAGWQAACGRLNPETIAAYEAASR